VKSVLSALENLLAVLDDLGRDDALDEKLAEYAFFPLSHVFNESQRLSSRCLEVAVRCLQILVTRGWRVKLAPEMGKQLLILLTLLAGGSPAKGQTEAPGDDLKVAAFDCMTALTKCMGQLQRSKPIFDEVGARTIVDQSIYMLLEAITDSPSDLVQLAAARALSSLLEQVSDRVILASLLPRTVSALTKALQPSTQVRRTYKVLQVHLEVLTNILYTVLNDGVAVNEAAALTGDGKSLQITREDEAEAPPVLDKSWLQATSSQVKLALTSVARLRNHDRKEVRQALVRLAAMVIEQCSQSLSDAVPLMVETIVVLANDRDSTTAFSTLKRLATTEPLLAESLKSSLHKWTASLPRVMQGNDDRPKERVLQQISTTFEVLSEINQTSDVLDNSLATSLVESVAAAVQSAAPRHAQAVSEPVRPSFSLINIEDAANYTGFEAVVLNHSSQKDSTMQLQNLIANLGNSPHSDALFRSILDRVTSSGSSRLAAIWLTLNFLRRAKANEASLDRFIDFPGDTVDSRPYLVSDMYSLTVPELLNNLNTDATESDWRLTALALESLTLQAQQLGSSYRPELIETLYPVLSLLGASQPELRTHAVTALNLLAKACDYSSTSDMLVQNVDYLVNSIALKLNTFDISPQAPQVLLMMIRLCGAKLIPYLDDLIGDIFAALDSFHSYPLLVELLFEVLGAVIEEGAREPSTTITDGKEPPQLRNQPYKPSTIDDIIADLRSHKARKNKTEPEHLEPRTPAPHRPWKGALGGPDNLHSPPSNRADEDDAASEGEGEEGEGEEGEGEEGEGEEGEGEEGEGEGEEGEEGEGEEGEGEEGDGDLPPPEKEQPLSKPHTLLLRIAESTPYHLSSPSPRVRLTILQLLARIATPLSADENTFLPLINSIWPALVPRLFAGSHAGDSSELEEGGTEPGYTVIAAANTVSALCVGAGNFMASRIEDMFPNLERMYRQVWARVAAKREREAGRRHGGKRRKLDGVSKTGEQLKGTVDLDLRLVKQESGATSMAKGTDPRTSQPSALVAEYQITARTSDDQVLNALIGLLVTIRTHVRITDDVGDTILELLAPVMDDPGRELVRDTLESWNGDAVWLIREQRKASIQQGG
jgi:TELO2-interacting protein 1